MKSKQTGQMMSASIQAGLMRFITCAFVLLLSVPYVPAAVRTWTGASGDNALASTAANWDTAVPEAGDSVLFNDSHAGNPQTNAVWDLDIELLNWTQTADYEGTVTIMTEYPDYEDGTGVTNLSITGDVVLNGGSWTHEGHPVDCDEERYRLAVTVGNDFTLGSEASVNVDEKGYPYEQGPGCGSGSTGAGYGGRGTYADNYGDPYAPDRLGSGGGHDAGYPSGGSGGGALLLTVTGTVTLNGTISSNGENGTGRSGGGSGGSIWLIAGKIEGDGMVTADGGSGSTSYLTAAGGGRIAFDTPDNSFAGIIRAKAGTGSSAMLARNGTFNFQSDPNLDLIISNDIALPPGTNWVFRSLTVTDGATFEIQSTPGTEGEDYADEIASHIRILGDVTVAADSHLSADGLGYWVQQGPGHGTGRGSGAYGGHGAPGRSGGGTSGTPGNTYGDPYAPDRLGSGGGDDGSGNAGGGALILELDGTLTVEGTMSANGTRSTYRGGGGSGGSIWIKAAAITGEGAITADGGTGATWAAGGGGGRIAFETDSNTFSGILRAQGESGSFVPGRSGTFNFQPDENLDLVIQHDIALPPGTNWTFRSLTVTDGATFEIQSTPGTEGEDYADEIASRVRILEDLVVAADSHLSADGMGYLCMEGPGAGAGTGTATGTGGGGYGGKGGASITGSNPGGDVYGSADEADRLGSGGGRIAGSSGGGALILEVAGTLTLEGILSADGEERGERNGGGSGGSVRIIAQSIEGNGAISADGGDTLISDRSGGGGGGRVFLIFGHVEDIDVRPDAGTITTDPPERLEFTGTITVTGGDGGDAEDGEDGTIRYRFRPPPQATIFTFY